ncbi:MAG TPA: hypothetical protein PLD20_24520 [Blastocatellia bacterium]|nr:hypothetical protein [Blastocatellia bacterium]HMZ21121.1 hypothetical protein [Blastocatellia bacterium]
MHTLGDYFSKEEKIRKFNESLVCGQVYYLDQSFLFREKNKYFLLVANTEPLSLFIINSKKPSLAVSNPHVDECQVLIEYVNHTSVVEHDCYIDCFQTCQKFSLEEIKEQVVNDPSRIKGTVSNDVLTLVYKAVMKAKKMSVNHKKPILKAIEEILQLAK